MQQKSYLKALVFFTVFITVLSGVKAAGRQELNVEELLYKGRTELGKDNPTGAIEYFTKALNKCNPGSTSYNSRYGRCNFFVGEGYFQRFVMQRHISDSRTAIKYFETVIDFGKKTNQDYPSLAKDRIRQTRQTRLAVMKQIRRASGVSKTGVSPKTGRTFKVKTVSKGKIVANSWNLYVNGERIDNPFVELFFIEDHSGDTPEALRKAVYISDAGAAEVARKLGIQRITQKEYSYDRYDVLNISRTFHKPGYTDIVLKNGERFNGQWAIIEYDLNMPALPVKLFEHFGASVQANWPERKVIINAKTGSPITKDWFDLVGELRLPPSGAGGDWIIGFQDFQLPEKIYSGQLVQGRVDLQIKGNARNSANAVIYISLFGDWSPSTKLARIYKGRVGQPRRVSIPFSFKAPSKPGTYRLRCPMVLAFAPVKNFYGSKPGGQNDPGIGPYTEVSFVVAKPRVNEPTTTQKTPESASIPAKDKGPTEAARKFIIALYSRSYDEMLEVVSDDVYAYQSGKGSYRLPYGRKAFKEWVSSFSFDKPPKIISLKEKNRLEGGTIALIEAVMQEQGENKYTCTLWFKKVNSQWLLFTPTTNLAGYRNSDVQAALQSFANTWARRGDQRYVNCRIKKAVPNTLQHTASLWLEIEYEYTSINYYGIGRAKSGTRISVVWMNRKSGSWEYGGMYHQ